MKGRGRIYFCIKYRSKLIRAEPDYVLLGIHRNTVGHRVAVEPVVSNNRVMYSWTSVMSQRGVEVAPQIPMLSFPSSHVGSISLMSETSRDWGLTCRHSPKSTRPLELFFPQTNRIRSCRRANSLILGMRLATCRQMVSNDSNCPSGFSCFISSTMCGNLLPT